MKIENTNCKKCNVNHRYKTSSYCRKCHNKCAADSYRKKAIIGKHINWQDLSNFVEKVRSRNGWVSLEEMLGELIGLHKQCCKEKGQWQFLTTSQQLEKMWKDLQTLYDTRKEYKK
jgi:hypothetical protein